MKIKKLVKQNTDLKNLDYFVLANSIFLLHQIPFPIDSNTSELIRFLSPPSCATSPPRGTGRSDDALGINCAGIV